MASFAPSRLASARWTVFCLTFLLAGCDPLGLASLFDSEPAGTSVLTLLDTDGREVEIGDEVHGALSASDMVGLNESYLEAWSFEGRSGQTVTVDLVSSDFDSYLYVVGPGLSETLRDDDGGGACHSRIRLTVLESGTFHIVASSSSSRQTGTYELRVSEEPRDAVAMSCGGIDGMSLISLGTNGRDIVRGQTAFGHLSGSEASIENDRPVQAWALYGEAGETVTVRLESDDFDAYLYLVGPGFNEVMTNDDGGVGLDSELTVTFTENGTFVIGAAALSSGSTGSYTLSVTDPIDLATLETGTRVLRLGSMFDGILTGADPVVEGRPAQAWAFRASAGDVATVELMSEDFDSYLQIAGPGLSSPLTNDDGGEDLDSRLDLTFPEDGVYRVIAASLGGDTGRYMLRVR